MNKKSFLLILVLINLIVFKGLVIAEYNQESFDKQLEELKNKGILTQELIDALENLSPEQKLVMISSVNPDSEKFWEQWKTDLNGNKKTAFLRGLNEENRNSFMKKYGEHFGIEFKGLGNERFLFADNNVLGNSQGYFQMDLVEQYNKNNPNNPLVLIEYKTDGKSSSLIFTKKDGSSLDLSASRLSRGELGNGFYFNPDSGYIGKVGADGLVDTKSLSTGYWNGIGNMKTEATSDRFVDISVDFNRNSKGKATNSESFSIFTNSREEAYSPYSHPTGEKDESGNPINELKPGKVTFDSDGKLFKLHNVYKAPGEKGWGGYYGEDTYILHNKEDYDKKQGFNRVMVDLEKGEVFADVKRVEEGLSADVRESLDKTQKEMAELEKKLNNQRVRQRIQEGYDKLNEVNRKIEETTENLAKLQPQYDKLGTLEKFDISNPTVRKYYETKAKLEGLGLERTGIRKKAREEIGKSLGLDPKSDLVKSLASENGLANLQATLGIAGGGASVAGDVASWLSRSAISFVENYFGNSPLLKSQNPAPGSRIDIEFSSEDAGKLKNVEVYSRGSISIRDSNGNLVPIVKSATPYGYFLDPTFNQQSDNTGDVNFNLITNLGEGNRQIINIFSDVNGNLNAVGLKYKNGEWVRVDLQDTQSVRGSFVVDAGGYVTVRYKALLGLVRGSRTEGEVQRVLTADYQVDPEKLAEAEEFDRTSNTAYTELYNQLGDPDGDGNYEWNAETTKRLTKIYNDNFVRYNQILNSGIVRLYVSSDRIPQDLDSFHTEGSSDDPILKQIKSDTLKDDKVLQEQLAERGIGIYRVTDIFLLEKRINEIVIKETERIKKIIKSNPSTHLEFTMDSKNRLYQIKIGGKSWPIDSVAGPFISNVLPVLVGSGGIDSNENFYIDTRNSRFGRNIYDVHSYGMYIRGLRAIQDAQENKEQTKVYVRDEVERSTKGLLRNPASGYVR